MAKARLKRQDYRLPPGPRGDTPSGRSGGGEQGRTGDMRSSSNWSTNVRKFPSAPFGRYENGFPRPQVVGRPSGQALPNARPYGDDERRTRRIPRGQTTPPTISRQKGWRS
jgi:hypothetical protein